MDVLIITVVYLIMLALSILCIIGGNQLGIVWAIVVGIISTVTWTVAWLYAIFS